MAVPLIATRATTRVLVVDDSAFMRRAIVRLLEGIPGVEVVGMAVNGVEAVQRALELRPDVITMDVEMPKMDGVTAVIEIMRTVPTPIVMLSTLTAEGAETTIRALEAGAVDCVAKPTGMSQDLVNVGERLAEAVRHAQGARMLRRVSLVPPGRPTATRVSTGGVPAHHVVVIGSSTGGPPALTEVIAHLPAGLNAAVLVVQHLPAGFTAALSRRLDALSPLPVAEAAEGDRLVNGRVLLAPGDFHMSVGTDRLIHLDKTAPLHGVRPAVDVTLASVASVFGRSSTLAILTGMGKDGAEGAARIEAAGGKVIVQDESTCVVYGMPKAAKERTEHAVQVKIDQVANAIARAVPAGVAR